MSTIPDLEAFLRIAIFRGGGIEKINCDESIEYAKRYLDGNTKNVDARVWIEKALADPEMPHQYRNRLRMYMDSTRALIAVQGRHGVEETGEWKVTYLFDDPDSESTYEKEVPFTNKQDCKDHIEEAIEFLYGKYDWARRYHIEYEDVYLVDGRFDQWDVATVSITMDELDQIPENKDVTVRNETGTFRVDGLRDKDEILQAAQKALELDKKELRKDFIIHKRIKPKGDPDWGNWWKRIEII